MKNETTTIEDATLITDYAGHVTNDNLLAIVTDEGVAGFQVKGQVCLVLEGELIDARQGPNRTWTAVTFDERHAEAVRKYNESADRNDAWYYSRIAI